MKTLFACLAIIGLALGCFYGWWLTGHALFYCADRSDPVTGGIAFGTAIGLSILVVRAISRLFLFIESADDRPQRINRRARRIARCPIERA